MARSTSLLGVAAAVVGGVVAGYAAERAVLRRARPSLPPADAPLGSLEGEIVEVAGPDGLRIVTETYGPDDAPQAVLVHGWLSTGRIWHEQVAALSDRFRLVTLDLPGHGRTPEPESRRYDLDLMGDALRAAVEEVSRPGPLVLVGHSLGGITVLNAVRRHGDVFDDRLAGVALMSTMSRARVGRGGRDVGYRGAVQLERLARRVTPLLRRPAIAGLASRLTPGASDVSYLVTRAMAVGPDASSRVVEFVERLALDSGADVLLGLTEAVFGADEDLGLTALTVPTVIVVGEEDRVTPPALSRRMVDRCAQAELLELPGVGHATPLEAPAEVNQVIERLVAGAGRQRADSDGEVA